MTDPQPSSPQQSASDAQPDRAVFRPDHMHLLALGIMLGIAFIVVMHKPLILWPVIPVFFVLMVYVRKASTTVSESGIAITHILPAQGTTVPWEKVEGLQLKRGAVYLHTTTGKKHQLPGVTFKSLPELIAASHGRISDPATPSDQTGS